MKKVIEIAGSSTEAECKELVSVTVGYRALLRKPDRKVIDILRLYRLLIIILSICLVLLAAEYMWEVTRTAVGGACIPISAFTLLLLLIVYLQIMKTYKSLLQDDASGTLTLDDDGVSIESSKAASVRLPWNRVAFVRAFENTVCFFDSGATGFLVYTSIEYKDEIAKYLTDSDIPVRRIGL